MWLKNTWTAPNWWAHGSQNQFVSNTFPLFPHNQSDRWETELFRPGNYSSDPFTSCSFIFLKFIKKEISNYLDYFQKHFFRPFLIHFHISQSICQTFSEVFECLWKYLYDHFRWFWIFLEIFVRPFLTFLNISEWFSFSWKKFLLSPETFPRTFLNPGLFDVTGLCTNRAIKQHLLSSGRINRISPVKGVQVVSAIEIYTVLSSKNFGLKWILSEMSIWHEKTFDVILRN